jgi:hypothetical protein
MQLELFGVTLKHIRLNQQERTSKDFLPMTRLSPLPLEDDHGRFSNRRDAIEPVSLQNGTSSRRDLGGSIDRDDGDTLLSSALVCFFARILARRLFLLMDDDDGEARRTTSPSSDATVAEEESSISFIRRRITSFRPSSTPCI